MCRRAINAEGCHRRLTVDECDDLGIDERLRVGDREAIYDAIVECRERLDGLRIEAAKLLVENVEILDRLADVHRKSLAVGNPLPVFRRKKKKDAAATDRGGKERQRSRINRSASASHGR
jgi:hypothetical protein